MLGSQGGRWIVLLAAAAVAALGLLAKGVSIDLSSIVAPVLAILVLAIFGATAGRTLRPFAGVRLHDMAASLAQYMACGAIGVPLSYLAGSLGAAFPLRDAWLAHVDEVVFGFDWQASTAWIDARPMLGKVLEFGYTSFPMQIGALLVVGSLMRPGSFNGEFQAAWMVASGLTLACFVVMPAEGLIGRCDPIYLELLRALRAGTWSEFTLNQVIGIVTFPSFHTTAAILFIYAASFLGRAVFGVFLALNVLMLLSVPAIGGHYLVDMVGGAVVAGLSIAVAAGAVRRRVALHPAVAAQSL